jgi:F-type H+-transporting ATPase subunit delta
MAELVTIARPYAKAAFKFARENNALAEWAAMLGFAAAVSQDADVKSALDNPQLTAEKQADMFISVCGDRLNEGGRNLVQQLAQNKRLATLPEVSHLFDLLLAEEQRSEEVVVTSAYELGEAEAQKLKQALATKLGKEINLQTTVDQSLIGGVVIRAGDLVIDSSVKGKLDKLSHSLN